MWDRRHRGLRSFLLSTLALCELVASAPAEEDGMCFGRGELTWQHLAQAPDAPRPGPRYASAGQALPGGGFVITHGYLYDGELQEPRWLNDTWFFDGSAWLPLAPKEPTSAPSARYGHTLNLATTHLSTAAGQKAEDQQHLLLLLFGGDAGGKWLSPHQYSALLYNDVWLLQLAFSRDASDREGTGRGQKILSMAWRQVQPVNAGRAGQAVMEGEEAEPVARQAHSAFVSNGCLIVFGGFNGRRSLNDLWKLCPKSGPRGLGPEGWQAGWGSSDGAEWQLIQHDDGVQANKGLQGETKNIASQGTAGPVARHFSAYTQDGDRYGYLFGGFHTGKPNLSDLWRLDLSAASAQDGHSRRNTVSLWTCLHPGGSPSTVSSTIHSSSNRVLPSHASLSPVARGGAALVLVPLPEKEERSRAMHQRDQEKEHQRDQEKERDRHYRHDRHYRMFGHDRMSAALLLLGGAKCEPICKCFGDVWMFHLSDEVSHDLPANESGRWSAMDVHGARGRGQDGDIDAGELPAARYKHVAMGLDWSAPQHRVIMFSGEAYRRAHDYHNDVWALHLPHVACESPSHKKEH